MRSVARCGIVRQGWARTGGARHGKVPEMGTQHAEAVREDESRRSQAMLGGAWQDPEGPTSAGPSSAWPSPAGLGVSLLGTARILERTTMSDEEKPSLVKSISDQLATVGDGIPIHELADRLGVKVNRLFRQTLWSAMEAYRAATGIHLEQANGCVRAVTAEEQVGHGKMRFRKARNSERRGFEILDAAAERDPAIAAKVGRVIHNATRNATQTATELRLRDDERRRALWAGTGPKKKSG